MKQVAVVVGYLDGNLQETTLAAFSYERTLVTLRSGCLNTSCVLCLHE